MFGATRSSLFGLALLAAAGGGGWILLASAESASLDTSRLPRVAGSKETFASPSSSIYTAPGSVAQTAEAVVKALGAAGWRKYAPPFSSQADNPNMRVMSLKKGPQAITVFITVAPAQGGATSVSYSAIALANDLPFPDDAADIAFDPNRPYLACSTRGSIDATLEFFRKELGSRGWSRWSAKEGARTASSGEKTESGAYAHYVHENQRPLLLLLQQEGDGKIKVKLESVPAELLTALAKSSASAPVASSAGATSSTARIEPNAAVDPAIGAIVSRAQRAAEEAAAAAAVSIDAVPQQAPRRAEEMLRPLAQNAAPIPLPETAEEVEFNASDGRLEFSSVSSVKALAEFHRAALKPLGWKERSSPLDRSNMMALGFSKGQKQLSFTIVQLGQKANVVVNGSGLTVATKAEAKASAPPAERPHTGSEDLTAEESGGFPVPKRRTSTASEKTPFRRELNASVPVDLADVLAFYRRELGARGWKEEKQSVASDRAELALASPEGPAVLTLVRNGGETSVKLALRNHAEAQKAGVLPKAGHAKLLLGNMLDSDAVVTIGKKSIKVVAGVGAKAPDGPTMDLAPGKYKYALKTAGGAPQNEEIEVGPDEAWGLLIGPGGALPLRVY